MAQTNSPLTEGVQQAWKVLDNITTHLKDHPLFLFGIAIVILAIIAEIAAVAFVSDVPQTLTWLPYAFLLFGVILIAIDTFKLLKPKANVSTWTKAQEIALSNFKKQRPQYDWSGFLAETARIDEVVPQGECEILTIVVSTTDLVKTGGNFRYPKDIEWHSVTIDIAGNIIKSHPIRTIERKNSDSAAHPDLLETDCVITKVVPSIQRLGGEARVHIEVTIQNRGKAGKVCPYVEFQVDFLNGDKLQVCRSNPKSFDIDALGEKSIVFKWVLKEPAVPLLQAPYKVKAELYKCP
jgi:hypothetical protein